MHRLLDEQSLLCSQLKVSLPGTVSTSSRFSPNRTEATQCCLLPGLGSSPPGSETMCEGQGSSPTKADELALVGFLQRVRKKLILKVLCTDIYNTPSIQPSIHPLLQPVQGHIGVGVGVGAGAYPSCPRVRGRLKILRRLRWNGTYGLQTLWTFKQREIH